MTESLSLHATSGARVAVERRAPAAPDAQADVARRLDWRFLLPDAVLGRVGLLGSPDDALLGGLRQYSESLTLLSDSPGEPLDVLVVHSPHVADVERAHRFLKPGGYLYWEIERARTRRFRAGGARDLKQLEGLGFTGIELHWHRPSFRACLEMIPLRPSGPLAYALARRTSGRVDRLKSLLGRVLAATGLLPALAPCVSVVARKGTRHPGVGRNALGTLLARPGSGCPLPHPGPPAEWAAIVRTPRFQTSSHVLFFVFAGDGPPILVAKAPRVPGNHTLLQREVANLRLVHAARPGGFDSIPRVVTYEQWHDTWWLVETALPGEPMRPPYVRRHPVACLNAGVEWVSTLHRETFTTSDGQGDWFERLVGSHLDALEAGLGPGFPESELVAHTRALGDRIRDAGLPLVFEHGDFSSPNILVAPDGTIGVVDWELGEPRGLPGSDLFFFLTYIALARDNAREPEQCLRAFRRAFFGRGAWAGPYLRRYAVALDLPPEVVRVLFALCWSRSAANFLLRIAHRRSEGSWRESLRHVASALRWNHHYALWRHAVEHLDELSA